MIAVLMAIAFIRYGYGLRVNNSCNVSSSMTIYLNNVSYTLYIKVTTNKDKDSMWDGAWGWVIKVKGMHMMTITPSIWSYKNNSVLHIHLFNDKILQKQT